MSIPARSEYTPEKVAELARRLRGDIFDAVPDDGDLQSVLDLAAEAADALTAVSAERDKAIAAGERILADAMDVSAERDELRSIISEQEKANRRLQSERDEREAALRAALDKEGQADG